MPDMLFSNCALTLAILFLTDLKALVIFFLFMVAYQISKGKKLYIIKVSLHSMMLRIINEPISITKDVNTSSGP